MLWSFEWTWCLCLPELVPRHCHGHSPSPCRSVHAGLSELLCCWNWATPPETEAAWECVRWIWMVLLPGLRLSSLTVHGFCSLHLGSSYQPERVHLNEGISCGMSGKLAAVQLPFLLFFKNNIFPPPIFFNLTIFFADISLYLENPFYLFTQLFFNTTKMYMHYSEWFHISNKLI